MEVGVRKYLSADGTDKYIDLFTASSVGIKRHIKIKAAATPYDPRFQDLLLEINEAVNKTEKTCLDSVAVDAFQVFLFI